MRLPEGVEWALHCAWLLALMPDQGALPARKLAEFHDLPQPYLAKILKSLVSACVLSSASGPHGGFRLARPPEEISVLDIVEAVEGRTQVFRCAEIRQRGPAPLTGEACRRPCGIARVMYDAEREWRSALARSTVAGLVAEAGPDSIRRAATWLAGASGGDAPAAAGG
jgi:Rrf2 family protein